MYVRKVNTSRLGPLDGDKATQASHQGHCEWEAMSSNTHMLNTIGCWVPYCHADEDQLIIRSEYGSFYIPTHNEGTGLD